MSVHVFRSFHSRFSGAGLSAMFAPRKPRHPLLRALLGVVGVLLLAGLLVVGLFVGVAMLAGGLVVRLLRQRGKPVAQDRSEEHTSELQSIMRITYAVFCLKKKKIEI